MKYLSTSFVLAALVVVTGGCSASPEQISDGIESTAFVQHGHRPLSFSTGVIDADSFWATYGDAVARQVSRQAGSGDVVDEWAADGKKEMAERAEQGALMVDLMFDRHPLVDTITAELMPSFADAWRLNYSPAELVLLPEHLAFIDPSDDSLHGVNIDADLILMIEVHEAHLTEKFSAGSVLANGVTLGTNDKSLTVETPVNLLVFRRDSDDTRHYLVWSRRCGANYTSMQTSYQFQTLWDFQQRMNEVLDEAADRSASHCRKVLSAL